MFPRRLLCLLLFASIYVQNVRFVNPLISAVHSHHDRFSLQGVVAMDWQDLLAELEAEAEALADRQREALAADLARDERRHVGISQRLAACIASTVSVQLASGEALTGQVDAVGSDWVLISDHHREHVVLLSHVHSIKGLSAQAKVISTSRIVAFMNAHWLLVRICQQRSQVSLRLVSGELCTARIEKVGADHLDLSNHQTVLVSAIVAITRI